MMDISAPGTLKRASSSSRIIQVRDDRNSPCSDREPFQAVGSLKGNLLRPSSCPSVLSAAQLYDAAQMYNSGVDASDTGKFDEVSPPDEVTKVMNFDAFITGSISIDNLNMYDESLQHLEISPIHEKECKNDVHESVCLDVDDNRRYNRQEKYNLSSSALFAAKINQVKEKTQQVAQNKKEALSKFRQKGGLVSWLHGEQNNLMNETVADLSKRHIDAGHGQEQILMDESISTVTSMAVDASLSKAAPSKQTTSEHVRPCLPSANDLESSIFVTNTAPQTNLFSPTSSGYLRNAFSRQRANSLVESFYKKNDGAKSNNIDHINTTATAGGRIALQPSPRRKQKDDTLTIGFDDFINTDGKSARAKLGRRRAASATVTSASSYLCTEQLPFEECLSDPKLAAEFVNIMLPNDSSSLMLLYSIDEFEVLVTSEPLPTFEVQAAFARTLIDKYLVDRLTSVTAKLADSTAADLYQAIESYHRSGAQAIPKTLFRAVSEVILTEFYYAYEKFKMTREYARFLEQYGRERSSILSMEAILNSEWNCTVFWMFLYRTSQHQQLSFIMDKSFKLDRLRRGCHDTNLQSKRNEAYESLVKQLRMVYKKYFHKTAPMAFPTSSARLSKMKEEVIIEMSRFDAIGLEPLSADRVMEILDDFACEVKEEFKRSTFELYGSFIASALYREFIIGEQSAAASGNDLIRLVRASRIAFHQAPNTPPVLHDLETVFAGHSDGNDDPSIDVIDRVFAFAKTDIIHADTHLQPFQYAMLFHGESSSNLSDANDKTLLQTIERFLVPEASPKTLQITDIEARQNMCFHFVAGNGESTLYGAVWRMPLIQQEGEDQHIVSTQGVCAVSKYPLLDSLRHYLRCLGTHFRASMHSNLFADDDHMKTALEDAKLSFDDYVRTRHKGSRVLSNDHLVRRLRPIDFSLQDLFDCLSITHILRLFTLVLLEKKIVLVASSYSLLVSVGEALKILLYPLVWSHVYVPVLPLALKGYLHCPTPFIFGLHSSYVRSSELPRPTDELAIVNLDRDSITGGGETGLPPLRMTSLREKLRRLCYPRLYNRDHIEFAEDDPKSIACFPTDTIRDAFRDELQNILMGLETFAFRFEFNDHVVSIVDTSKASTHLPSDSARFLSKLLQTQAFSTYLSSL